MKAKGDLGLKANAKVIPCGTSPVTNPTQPQLFTFGLRHESAGSQAAEIPKA